MTETDSEAPRIDLGTLKAWIEEIKAGSITDSDAKGQYELGFAQGMKEGLDLLKCWLNTWAAHQQKRREVAESGAQLIVVKDIEITDVSYSKLEWYEVNHLISLSFIRPRNEEVAKIRLRVMDLRDLSKENLLYQGTHSYRDLAEAARKDGLSAIRQGENCRQWIPER